MSYYSSISGEIRIFPPLTFVERAVVSARWPDGSPVALEE